MIYDAKNHVTPICFAHSVGTEFSQLWEEVFDSVTEIEGFNVDGRVTNVDQEKIIDSYLDSCMKHVRICLDMLHVKKNMAPIIGS